MKAVLLAIGFAVLVAVPIVRFYVMEPEGTPVANTQIESDDNAQQKVEIELRETVEKPVRSTPDPDDSTDGLTEVQPDGELQEPVPVKKPVRKAVRQKQVLAHLPDPDLIERGATGVIPKKSADGLRPMDVYSRQPATEGNFGVARVVLVIGGMGISQTSSKMAIENLPGSVTFAFAPYGNSLNRWMQQARRAGHEILLQVPMEPVGYPANNPGVHTLRSDATAQENLANLHWAMSRFTNYVGVMNYLGGRFLNQASAGAVPVFNELAGRGLLFLEDGTVKNSLGPGLAVKSLLPYAQADIQIDSVRSRAAIAKKLEQLAVQAKRTGLAIGVGNAFPDTIRMVAEFAAQAEGLGIEITPVSAVVKDPQG